MKTLLRIVLIIVITILTPKQVEAQLLRKLKNHAEQKIKNETERRSERRIDKQIDKEFDDAEDMIDGKKEKKKKKNKTSKNENSINTEVSQENEQQNNSTKKTKEENHKPKIVWSRFDFVPGDTVVFEDSPSPDEENGEFPSRWDLHKGSAEIAEVDGENVIMFPSGSSYIVPYLKNSNEDYLPEIFTIEMDVWFPKGTTTSNRFWVYLGDQKNNNRSSASHKSLVIMPHSLEFDNSGNYYPGTEKTGWTVEKTGSWKHISIAYTKGKYKVYFNDTRLINIPHLQVNPSGLTIEAGRKGMYIKNIRIAKGGVKYYNRVQTDGKIIVNGIKFDVNKASLKPESMGPINKIYKLMVKKPDLRFSVEGHTDSDGDQAHNQTLSEARAKSVMNKLISMGINGSRLKHKGFGESKPIDNNNTPEGKANNRRVEFIKF
jgi:outer membrane protein OmpA-like peptidoglycan-associated protein